MAHLFEVTDRADSLQASEGVTRETLQQAQRTLISLLAAMDVDTGTVDISQVSCITTLHSKIIHVNTNFVFIFQDTNTTVGGANRLLQYVNLLAENYQVRT